MRRILLMPCIVWLVGATVATQTGSQLDWTAVQDETMRHYQALLRLDTSNPPGDERLVVDYLAGHRARHDNETAEIHLKGRGQ